MTTFAKESDRLVAPLSHEEARSLGEHVDPHAIRIAGKSLRYTLEMARVQSFEFSGDVLKSFKQMQDALGLWHDFIVLTERMLSISGDEQLAHHDAPMQRAVLGLAQVTLRKSEEQLDLFADRWLEKGTRIRDAIARIAAPGATSASSVVITESQTDLDPSATTPSAGPAAPASDAPEAA
jgi:CHAD domain-containing protein